MTTDRGTLDGRMTIAFYDHTLSCLGTNATPCGHSHARGRCCPVIFDITSILNHGYSTDVLDTVWQQASTGDWRLVENQFFTVMCLTDFSGLDLPEDFCTWYAKWRRQNVQVIAMGETKGPFIIGSDCFSWKAASVTIPFLPDCGFRCLEICS